MPIISYRSITPKQFRLIDSRVVDRNLRDGMREYLEKVKKIMQDNYNTTQSPTVYKRTYELQKGWKVYVRSNNYGDLINDATEKTGRRKQYAAYVQGPRTGGVGQRQTPFMRRRGWKSITDVTRETRRDFVKVMSRKIRGGAF